MKNIKLLLLLLLAWAGQSAMGQSTLWRDTTTPTDSAIVRHWREGKYLVCAHEMAGGYIFQYHDNAVNNTIRMQLPAGLRVNDFRIFHDSVFLCGSMANRGYLACFAVQDMFGSGAPVSWMPTNDMNMRSSNCNINAWDRITSITRLDVFEHGGKTHIAFVAPNEIEMDGRVVYERIGLGDATFNGVAWNIEYLYNKDGHEEFSDIAATDNYVVAASVTNDSSLVQFRVFGQGASYLTLALPTADERWSTNDQFGIGRAMVAPMMNDAFAVASHYKTGTEEGLAVKVYQISGGTVTLVQSLNMPISTTNISAWELGDIRYCTRTNSLLMVDQMDDPTTGLLRSYIVTVDLSNPANTRREYLNMRSLYSLDVISDGRFQAAGNTGSALHVLSERTLAGNDCTQTESLRVVPTTPNLYRQTRHRCYLIETIRNDTYSALTKKSQMRIICN